MRVYLAPIIIVALLVVALVVFVSCSTGFRGSIGNASPAASGQTALAMQ